MNVTPSFQPVSQVAADYLAIGLFDEPIEQVPGLEGTPLQELVKRMITSGDLPRSVGDVTPLHGASGPNGSNVVVFGLGSRDVPPVGSAYAAGMAVGKRLSAKPRENVAVLVPGSDDLAAFVSAITEGVCVGVRGPGLRKSEPARHPFGSLVIVMPPEVQNEPAPAVRAAVERGRILGDAVNLARELANTPPSEKPPSQLAARAAREVEGLAIDCEVWDRARIEHERFGGLLGVSAGSDQPPAFVTLSYRQGGDGPTLALVGKGVTFDSGGLSLKPTASMEDMKCDMTGAAVVLATMTAAARLQLPVNVRGYLAMTENMTGGRAMKLGDVLTMRNGKTVEVLNTDAEGRLILADALSYAVESKPDRVLDLATLTGACVVALGGKIAGLFTNNDAFAESLLESCRSTGERAWRLPLDKDFKEGLKSHVADLKNVAGKWGGAITAAMFLQEFVAETPWIHLDIAGPSWAESDTPSADVGGTGCFVRTLVAFLESGISREKADRP
jgi:leucyl aminopeptidase